jgi:hypothetical protein
LQIKAVQAPEMVMPKADRDPDDDGDDEVSNLGFRV